MPRHRRTVALAVSLVAALTFTACGDDSNESTSTASSTDAPSTTVAPTTTEAQTATTAAATASALAGEEAEIAAIYETVFDSNAPVEDKIDLIVGGEELRSTIESYATAGAAVGGISMKTSSVTIDGSTASIEYSVLFAGVEQYTGQKGELVNDGGWKVPREQFCSIMASARNACP